MHIITLLGIVGLVAGLAVDRRAESGSPSQSKSKGFTLVVNVTDPRTAFEKKIHGMSLTALHDGAGLAFAGIYEDSARIWYLNGTKDELLERKGSVITDGGTPLFPSGISLKPADKDRLAAVRVDAGPGTPGVQFGGYPNPFSYLTGPIGGFYVVCNESVAYYQGQHFLVLKYAGRSRASGGGSRRSVEEENESEVEARDASRLPDNCAAINLLPQCAKLPALPAGSLSSHKYAKTVGCYRNVKKVNWNQKTGERGCTGSGRDD